VNRLWPNSEDRQVKVAWLLWGLFSFFSVAMLIYGIEYGVDFSYVNILLFLDFWVFVFLLVWSVKSVSWLQKIGAFTVSFIIAVLAWSSFSYASYYSGVRVAVDSEAQSLYFSVKAVLSLDILENDKLTLINQLVQGEGKPRAAILLTKNGGVFSTKPYRSGVTEVYVPEKISYTIKQKEIYGTRYSDTDPNKYVPFDPIYVNGDVYEFFYEYANKPAWNIGVLRAVTMSAVDNYSYKHYISSRLYERSYNFVFPFFLLFLSMMFVLRSNANMKKANKELEVKKEELEQVNFEVEAQKDELEQTNYRLNEINHKLENFQQAYNKIQYDFSAVVSNSKNNLQHMQSSWDEDLKAATGLGRHDVFNRIRALRSMDIEQLDEMISNEKIYNQKAREGLISFKQLLLCIREEFNEDIIADAYDFVIGPWVKIIHKELKGLEGTLDITTDVYPVSQILSSIDQAVPTNIAEGRAADVMFTKYIAPNINTSARCKVILSKVRSIIFNLIANSAAATETYADNLDDEEYLQYKRKIWLNVQEIVEKQKKYLCIEVQDNGGGFPEEILDKIYKEPIRTTKDNRTHGQGTSYIGFFVDLMGGDIKATNIISDTGEKGASTRLYIQYLDTEA